MTAEPNAAAFEPAHDDVFGRIAGRYDRLCDLFSLGAHRIWKQQLAGRMAALPGEDILDLASGTGDIPLRLARRLGPDHQRRVRVTDLCPQMLQIASVKLEGARGIAAIGLADAENLVEIAEASMDIVSIAFGMKICRPAPRRGGGAACSAAGRDVPVP